MGVHGRGFSAAIVPMLNSHILILNENIVPRSGLPAPPFPLAMEVPHPHHRHSLSHPASARQSVSSQENGVEGNTRRDEVPRLRSSFWADREQADCRKLSPVAISSKSCGRCRYPITDETQTIDICNNDMYSIPVAGSLEYDCTVSIGSAAILSLCTVGLYVVEARFRPAVSHGRSNGSAACQQCLLTLLRNNRQLSPGVPFCECKANVHQAITPSEQRQSDYPLLHLHQTMPDLLQDH